MTFALLEEKRDTLKATAKRLWEMSREAERLAREVPEEFDAEYEIDSGYTSDNDNVEFALEWLSQACDDLGGAAQLVEQQIMAVDVAESMCAKFSSALFWYLHGDEFTELRDVNETRHAALDALILAGLSKSQAKMQLVIIENDICDDMEK